MENRFQLSIFYVFTILFLVWLTIITVIFGFIYSSQNQKTKDIHQINSFLQEELQEVVTPCCSDVSQNCTCQGTSSRIECWDAALNIPPLISSVGDPSLQYVVCTPGTTNLNGNNFWMIGDYLRFNTDTETWFKNDASGNSISKEVYNITFSLVESVTLFTFGNILQNTTVPVTIFSIGNGMGIMNIPTIAFTSFPELPEQCIISPGTDVICQYKLTSLIPQTPLPAGRRISVNARGLPQIQMSFRNCNYDRPFPCGIACGNDSIIRIQSNVLQLRNVVNSFSQWRINPSTGLFEYPLVFMPSIDFDALTASFRGCVVTRPISFLYQFT